MKEFKEGNLVLARHLSEGDFKKWLNFFSSDSEFIQVGVLGYDKGKKLLAHRHNEVKREVFLTQEVLFIKQGSIRARIYDSKENLVGELEVKSGEVLVALTGLWYLRGWHSGFGGEKWSLCGRRTWQGEDRKWVIKKLAFQRS